MTIIEADLINKLEVNMKSNLLMVAFVLAGFIIGGILIYYGTHKSKKVVEIIYEGEKAALTGKRINDNPYEDVDQSKIWRRSFLRAKHRME